MGASVGDVLAVRLTDRISSGVLAEVFPRDVIEDVLAETGRRERRTRLLPAHVMVRFCQAMCLFFDDDYEEVLRKLVGSLKSMGSWRDDWRIPSTSAITQARQRLGAEPLRVLFERTAVPVACRGTKGAWLGGRRLMAVDGFLLDVPDTERNASEFDSKGNKAKTGAFPQVLTVALGECGSHAIVGAAVGACNGDEPALAEQIIPRLESDMLVMADRNFYSFALWGNTTNLSHFPWSGPILMSAWPRAKGLSVCPLGTVTPLLEGNPWCARWCKDPEGVADCHPKPPLTCRNAP
nr:transposase domain-containing protein [Actinokineospora inagensis]